MLWGFYHHDFEGRPDMRFQQVPTVCQAIRLANDHMSMELRLPVSERYISDEGKDLDLFMQRNPFVVLPLAFEVSENHVAKRTHRGEVGSGYLPLLGKLLETGDDFITFGENDRERLLAVLFVDKLGFHMAFVTSPGEILVLTRSVDG